MSRLSFRSRSNSYRPVSSRNRGRNLESLETRCLLAADGLNLQDDALDARQNDDQTMVISVLDNDRFDADYRLSSRSGD